MLGCSGVLAVITACDCILLFLEWILLQKCLNSCFKWMTELFPWRRENKRYLSVLVVDSDVGDDIKGQLDAVALFCDGIWL